MKNMDFDYEKELQQRRRKLIVVPIVAILINVMYFVLIVICILSKRKMDNIWFSDTWGISEAIITAFYIWVTLYTILYLGIVYKFYPLNIQKYLMVLKSILAGITIVMIGCLLFGNIMMVAVAAILGISLCGMRMEMARFLIELEEEEE